MIGPIVEAVDVNPPRSSPTDTATAFVEGITERGPVGVPTGLTSMAQKASVYGARQTWDTTSDAIETAFAEGASLVYVSRRVGPSPVAASAPIYDQAGSAAGDVVGTLSAKNAGEWGNALGFTITVSGGTFVVALTDASSNVLEQSPALADRNALKAWADNVSLLANFALGVANEVPRAQGRTALTGGTDDRTNITDAQRKAALDAFGRTLGPGTLISPGSSTTAAHAQIAAHCLANNRVAHVDLPVTGDVPTLVAAYNALKALPGSHLVDNPGCTPGIIPGTVPGTSRTVPYSAAQAGLDARSDALNSPSEGVAGDNGICRFVYDLLYHWTDAQYDALRAAGMSPAVVDNGQVKTMGVGSAADLTAKPLWGQFPAARLMMALRAECAAVAARSQFKKIDGKGLVFGQLKSNLEGQVLLPYFRDGSLYGDTPETAFRVDIGPQVNTEASKAAGYIKAAVGVRISPNADFVYIQIARQAITQAL